ncbi:MAG: hypothetical protein BWZ03_00201 [bacterium ADurb.BinA186]|nr:MAG: hypothetical protein BWZ03_00201 [bacterium ADurb.BinA186]
MARPKEFEDRLKIGLTCEKDDDEALIDLTKRLKISKSEFFRLVVRTTYALMLDKNNDIQGIKTNAKNQNKLPYDDYSVYLKAMDLDKDFRMKYFTLLKENVKAMRKKKK